MTDRSQEAKLSVVVVDDEPLARNMLVRYIAQMPALELVGQYDSCIACYEAHDLDTLDILLLDVHIPDISGIQFARTIAKHKARIIFTTAHTEHAYEAYQAHAVDYLLKPFPLDRFQVAIQKAQESITGKRINGAAPAMLSPEIPDSARRFIFVKSDYKTVRLNLDEILYVEGLQEYVRIHVTRGKPVIVLMSLKRLADILPSPPFFRVHRSYIVNVEHLEFVQQRSITIAGKELSIGKNYGGEFFDYLAEHSIF
jgi:two-component system LytT family response regulator